MDTVKVTFRENKVIEAKKKTLLSEILANAGYRQDYVCGGKGTCGKCAVDIVLNGKVKTVMSCGYFVEHDIEVSHIHNFISNEINVLETGSQNDYEFSPNTILIKVNAKDLLPEHCGSFSQHLKDTYQLSIESHAMKVFSEKYLYGCNEQDYYLFICDHTVIDIIRVEDYLAMYGMAVDIGTTTVVCYIYDLKTGEKIRTYSALNLQTEYGADVITRINYCVTNKERHGTEILRNKIIDTLNGLLEDAKNDGVLIDQIYRVVICGNTTMQHLFLGYYPENLGMAPFISITQDVVELWGKESMLHVNAFAKVTFLPTLGGFVGADTLAVILSLEEDNKTRLVLDLGTNGEIVCGNSQKYMVTSTACGPALEGAGLSCGMRACSGAIQHFIITNDYDVKLNVIDQKAPIGVCGSGVIDIFAELFKHGIINKRGNLLSADQYESKYGYTPISQRLQKIEIGSRKVNCFVLAFPEESGNGQRIYFSQLDAREIQKAKGAIAAGWRILLKMYDIELESLDEICLAGAFGNYLNISNAQAIGILPSVKGVEIRSLGNGAGTGAQRYLLDKSAKEKCEKIISVAIHQELNFHPDFDAVYLEELQSL